MLKRVLFLAISLFLTLPGNAQQASAHRFAVPLSGTVDMQNPPEDFRVSLRNLEAPHPGGNSYRDWLEKRKQELAEDFVPQPAPALRTAGGPGPTLGMNFHANPSFQGVPNDNAMAIGPDDKVISAVNSNIYWYDATTGVSSGNITLGAFSSSLGLNTSKYDPKAYYDPAADRFVLCYLSGFTDTTSDVVLAFSQSNDPGGAWNLYTLPGNPLNDTSWTDFPMMALTDEEAFLTVNLLIPDQSWQTGFRQTVIWQIDKNRCYAGDSLVAQLHTDIEYQGRRLRNLRPVRKGYGIGGPNMYFLSNRNFDAANDTLFLVEVTDTMGAPGQAVNVQAIISDTDYGMPPNGQQLFNQWLATNDARVLGAFMADDHIQFVSNTVNPINGRAAIYHGIIQNVSTAPTVTGTVIGDSVLDYGYANISWMGSGTGDMESVISYNYSDIDSFAGCAARYYDGAGGYSEPTIIRKGDNYINVLSGSTERWGDYSATQPDYARPGHIWVAVGYGASNRTYTTQIAELSAPGAVAVNPPLQTQAAELWPNPAPQWFSLRFRLEKAEFMDISLYDMQGRKVRTFHHDKVKSGENEFRFDTGPLPAGMYLLRMQGNGGFSHSEKIVVE